ncbi:MAG: histidine ammonia-lyase, partial [Sphingomonadales bacterium]|nr:histidine ammonia-lyase [Sphingomonadales bacterium]
SPGSATRIAQAHQIVEAIVARRIPAYGVNTGVGALVDTAVNDAAQRQLSRNLVMSHATGVGAPLPAEQVRAIIAAQLNNFAHGRSGVRVEVADALVALLNHGIIPQVPTGGSVGYLTHAAHIALVLIGEGEAWFENELLPGAEALSRVGLAPLVLEAKEGLSLLNGDPCATGMGCLAWARASLASESADAVAALTLEALGAQMAAFDADVLALRDSPGIRLVGANLSHYLAGIGGAGAGRLQDALSMRAVPQAHGGVRDTLAYVEAMLAAELRSVTDNPIVGGSPAAPVVQSEAHAVATGLAIALDGLAVATAHLGMISERRLDRLVNPAVSGLTPFLASEPGVTSGFMIAQYSAAALVGENRRLAAPASLDGGITSALQEDYLAHPTAAALKALKVVENVEMILGIELAAAAEAQDRAIASDDRAPGTAALHRRVRAAIAPYADDRPLATVMRIAADLVRQGLSTVMPR